MGRVAAERIQHEGHSLTVRKETKKGEMLHCSDRDKYKCPALLHRTTSGRIVKSKSHSHAPDPDKYKVRLSQSLEMFS